MLTKKSYPYKHWLTSIALTPILVIVDDTILLDWVRLVNHLQSYQLLPNLTLLQVQHLLQFVKEIALL